MRSRLQWLLASGMLLAGVVALWQHREIDRLQRETVRVPALRAETERLRRENAERTGRETAPGDAERLRAETLELARLRNTVRQLREQARNGPPPARPTPALPSPAADAPNPRRKPALATIPFATAVNAGHLTPEATLQSLLWSMREGQLEGMLSCLSPRARESSGLGDGDRAREKFLAESTHLKNVLQSMEILARQETDDGGLKLGLRIRMEQNGDVLEEEVVLPFVRTGAEWHLDQGP